MLNELKHKYNKWLFDKFGFERGAFFENIPARYKINPLFSPSIYGQYEGEQAANWFNEGVEAWMKEESQFKEQIRKIEERIEPGEQ